MELQGFKTFAKKTVLAFPGPKDHHYPVTCIVGPNGSGKSNLVDAIRWAMGEQSLKVIRGKKSEDVIFSGSEGRVRAGFAEVSLTFDNQDKMMPVEYSEVMITRRLYRDGASEYLLNGEATRLSDIHLLLAQANVGQRSYAVIGQGMVDHILVATPEERKHFFDDATGVQSLQIKRHETLLKLRRTYENLQEVERIMQEIEPRLKSLKRQVSRLDERESVEKQLHDLEARYYGALWHELTAATIKAAEAERKVGDEVAVLLATLAEEEAQMTKIELAETKEEKDEGWVALQKSYQTLQQQLRQARDKQFEVQKTIEMERVRAQTNWAPLPLSKMIEELQSIVREQEEILKHLQKDTATTSLKDTEGLAQRIFERSRTLLGRLQRPNPEDVKIDPALVASLDTAKKEEERIKEELTKQEAAFAERAQQEKKQRTEVFEGQRRLRALQEQRHGLEGRRHQAAIERTRLDERLNGLLREMQETLRDRFDVVKNAPVSTNAVVPQSIYPEIQRLRYKLELIGGIDPEIVKEYQETQTRFSFLEEQMNDLSQGTKKAEVLLDELDKEIVGKSDKAFEKINHSFQHFFKILFGGGSCKLVKMTQEDLTIEEEGTVGKPETESKDDVETKFKERQDRIIGVDIEATPPGKKLKSLSLLSGGERALTALALVSAIMSVNPSPFIILDEVDAALDEANTIRFAAILEELRKFTQFIVITHNRASMEKGDVLYGVSMGEGGMSDLLSVKLEDIAAGGTARR